MGAQIPPGDFRWVPDSETRTSDHPVGLNIKPLNVVTARVRYDRNNEALREKIADNMSKAPLKLRIMPLPARIPDTVSKVCKWLFDKRISRNTIVFEYDTISLSKGVFETLEPHCKIKNGLISAWARILNVQEEEKAPDAPSRFDFDLGLSGTMEEPTHEERYTGFVEWLNNNMIVDDEMLKNYDLHSWVHK